MVTTMSKFILILFVLSSLGSCDKKGGGSLIGIGDLIESLSPISFDGISSISNISQTSLRINWSNVTGAATYSIYNTTSETYVHVADVSAPTNFYDVSGLSPETDYKFLVRMTDTNDLKDTNVVQEPATTLPSVSPISFGGISSISSVLQTSLKINWSHVAGAATYTVYIIVSGSQVHVADVVAPTNFYDVSGLSPITDYKYLVRMIDTNSIPDDNTVEVTATTLCPENFIPVPANPTVNTNDDFCVAKYEMKNDGSSNAVSQAASVPWVMIQQSMYPAAEDGTSTAKYKCEQMDGASNNYFLISNAEWMTIARNIETNTTYEAYNWSGGIVGDGNIFKGHSDDSPSTQVAASSNDLDTDFNTAPGLQQRTHKLSNGEVIWDFAGNAWEWIDFNIEQADKAYDATSGTQNAFIEWDLSRYKNQSGRCNVRRYLASF